MKVLALAAKTGSHVTARFSPRRLMAGAWQKKTGRTSYYRQAKPRSRTGDKTTAHEPAFAGRTCPPPGKGRGHDPSHARRGLRRRASAPLPPRPVDDAVAGAQARQAESASALQGDPGDPGRAPARAGRPARRRRLRLARGLSGCLCEPPPPPTPFQHRPTDVLASTRRSPTPALYETSR